MASTSRKALLAAGLLTGFASAKSPMALPESLASLLYDVRLDDDTLRVRWGGSTVAAAIAGTQTYRGHFECVQNGVRSIFAAMSDGANHVTVYRSIDGGLTWASVTPTSGTFGDTRLTDVGPVFFAIVSDGTTDYVVMQNGVDSPRLYSGTTTSIVTAATHAPYNVRTGVNLGPQAAFSTSPAPTDSNTAQLDGSITMQAGWSILSLLVKTAVTTTATTVVSFTSFVAGSDAGLQFVWLVDSGDETWRGVKIEAAASSAGPWTTVYDPASTSLIAEPADGTAYLAGVDAGPILGATIGAYRFSYQSDPPAANVTVKFLTMGLGGLVPGGTAYGVAFGSSTSPQTSAGTISTNVGRANYAGVFIPISRLFGYLYTVRVGAQAIPPGYDRAFTYRNDPGTAGYYYVGSSAVLSMAAFTAYIDQNQNAPNLARPLPRADALSLPIGTAMATINDRLFVCSGNRLYYSAAGNPFSFALLVGSTSSGSIDTLSAASFSKPGEKMTTVIGVGSVLTGAESLGTPQSGAVSVYVATDITTYVLSGFDALSLNKTAPVCIGSRSPFSFARAASGGFFFLDSENQIRRVQGTDSAPLSRYVVDDQTRGIPDARLVWAAGAFFDERYYLAFTPQGAAANTRVLVYNLARGFESIDRPESPAQGLTSYYDPATSRTRLFQFTTVGLAEHSQFGKTTEASGARVSASVTLREQSGGESNLIAGDLTIVADPDPQGTVTFGYDVSTGTRTGTLAVPPVKLDPRPANAKRVARLTSLNVGADSLSVVLTMGILALGGTRIYSVSMGFSPGSNAATR